MGGRGGEHWRCPICSKWHQGVATIFGPHVPEAWRHATPLERAGGLIGPELCSVTIEGARHHFVRGHLELPVDDEQLDPFTWSVWVEVTEADLRRLVEHWDDQDREDAVGVLAGRLATELPYPQTTMGLAVELVSRPPGEVPLVRLRPDFAHELVHEQQEGITVHRVAEFNRIVLD